MDTTKKFGSELAVPIGLIMRHIYKVLDKIQIQDREDVVQEVLIQLFRHRERLPKEIHNLLAWVKTTTRNRSYDYLRSFYKEMMWVDKGCEIWTGMDDEKLEKHDAMHRRIDVAAPQCEVEPDGSDQMCPDLKHKLRSALMKLSVAQRQVLVMKAEGFSYEEIAATQDVNIGTVRSRLSWARKRMREMLEL